MKLFVFCGFFRFFHDFSWCNWKATDKKYKWKLFFEDFTTFVRCSSRAETILWIFLVDFSFLFEQLYLFFVSFCFLVDDPSQLKEKQKKMLKHLMISNCALKIVHLNCVNGTYKQTRYSKYKIKGQHFLLDKSSGEIISKFKRYFMPPLKVIVISWVHGGFQTQKCI